MRKEDALSQRIATYMNFQYPNIVYHFDTGSGATSSIGLAMRNKRLNRWKGFPDLFIAEPKAMYCGLFIEIKAESIYKKNGELKKSDHINVQRSMLNILRGSGYYTSFGCGFDEIKRIIDEYLQLT